MKTFADNPWFKFVSQEVMVADILEARYIRTLPRLHPIRNQLIFIMIPIIW